MAGHGLDEAIVSLRRELGDVRAMSNCPTCECFLGVVAQAVADLERIDSPAADLVRGEFESWLVQAEGRMRSCQHCEVCVPAGPYQRFREATGGATNETGGEAAGELPRPEDSSAADSCSADAGACGPRCCT